MPRAAIAILALLVLASVGGYALEAGLENAGEDVTIVNETWTPNAGQAVALEESNLGLAFYDNETTVYDENGTLMDRGTDYKWYVGNGTVQAISGGGLDGDADATITYGYQLTTETQQGMTALLARLPQIIGLAAPLLLVGLFLLFIKG